MKTVMSVALFAATIVAKIPPNPNGVAPFAPVPDNGPLSGTAGAFMFGSTFYPDGALAASPFGVSLWVVDGNTALPVGPLAAAPTPGAPAAVPYSIGFTEPVGNVSATPLARWWGSDFTTAAERPPAPTRSSSRSTRMGS